MGRTIIFEKSLEDNVSNLFNSSNKLQVGLILGQQSDAKDFCVHLVRCPDPVDDEAEIEMSSSGEDDVVVVKTSKKKISDSSTKTASESDIIDMQWITEHARQVNRMLTGGINVLGLFIYCSPEILAKNQSRIPQCMINLHKRIERNKWIRKGYLHNDRYMLHICSVTRKLTCRTINVLDDQPSLKPVEHRYQSFLNGWNTISTVVDTHINICVPLSQKAEIESTILSACQDEIEMIWDSYVTVDYKLVDEEQLINSSIAKGKNKQEIGKEVKLTLFKSPISKVKNVVSYKIANLEVKFFGSIQSRAFLHHKATYKDAIMAVKVDVVRSLLTRIELLCEEAEVNNLDGVEEWSLVSPTRVFVPYQSFPVLFCDYSFKDESNDDISGRFAELLNIKPESAELIFVERSPDVSEVSMIFHSSEKAVDQQSDIASEISNSMLEETNDHRFVYILVGLVILLIAIALHLVFNN